MATPSNPRPGLLRPRNLIIAAIYIAVALAIVFMLARPSADQARAARQEELGEHVTDTATSPKPDSQPSPGSAGAAGRRPTTPQPAR
jgi:hypothetical protein